MVDPDFDKALEADAEALDEAGEQALVEMAEALADPDRDDSW